MAQRRRFDLVFIDVDTPSDPVSLKWSLKLTRPGSLIVGGKGYDGSALAAVTG
ncbi:hypothetical protein AB0D11_28980 [Streptomyces monashensis]|uniref:hypothetical protein n=1 Tax=Streptomyces monashensis TaxID=1678012 RepID=UPI00340105AF